MVRKLKVLFLSTGNSTRSQMAEGLTRALSHDSLIAASAGLEADALNPLAIEVMQEVGIDISTQKSKPVRDFLKEHFSFVITVSDMAKERSPIFPFTPHLMHWDLPDPIRGNASPEEQKEALRRVRDVIRVNVESFLSDTAVKESVRAAATG
ncbi:MAG TPA: arsenate reductase ArsC [Candidatus Acidoferrales bacterium]|jgi:arsenate reductase|nr:arsenate reductase ArsC [Candidatus Acidoferrales bacterium]